MGLKSFFSDLFNPAAAAMKIDNKKISEAVASAQKKADEGWRLDAAKREFSEILANSRGIKVEDLQVDEISILDGMDLKQVNEMIELAKGSDSKPANSPDVDADPDRDPVIAKIGANGVITDDPGDEAENVFGSISSIPVEKLSGGGLAMGPIPIIGTVNASSSMSTAPMAAGAVNPVYAGAPVTWLSDVTTITGVEPSNLYTGAANIAGLEHNDGSALSKVPHVNSISHEPVTDDTEAPEVTDNPVPDTQEEVERTFGDDPNVLPKRAYSFAGWSAEKSTEAGYEDMPAYAKFVDQNGEATQLTRKEMAEAMYHQDVDDSAWPDGYPTRELCQQAFDHQDRILATSIKSAKHEYEFIGWLRNETDQTELGQKFGRAVFMDSKGHTQVHSAAVLSKSMYFADNGGEWKRGRLEREVAQQAFDHPEKVLTAE